MEVSTTRSQSISKIPATASNRSTNDLDLIYDLFNALDPSDSFLRQLWGGFAARGVGLFPVSVALVGMRDLRDYIMWSKDGVKEDSVTLSAFTAADVRSLIEQHRSETGQAFSDQAVTRVWELTRG